MLYFLLRENTFDNNERKPINHVTGKDKVKIMDEITVLSISEYEEVKAHLEAKGVYYSVENESDYSGFQATFTVIG